MTYGAETWTLTKLAQNKLAAAQTKMERSMLNITYKDRRTNIWVRERTKLINIIYTVRKMKCSWAGHILTRFNNIATKGAPQMAVDKEANSLSRVYSYYSKFNLRLFYM